MPYSSDIQHAIISFVSTYPPYNESSNLLTNLKQFSNGIVFANLLATVRNFPLDSRELKAQTKKWPEKLTNLKIILQKMQAYISQAGKSLVTKDIDLIQIAKQESYEHIQKFFQLVVTVFMQSSHKEDYIQNIMHLDQRCQQALVIIVQNAIDQRLVDYVQQNSNTKLLLHIEQINTQNDLLREEVSQLTQVNDKNRKQIQQLRQRIEQLEQSYQKHKNQSIDSMSQHLKSQVDQLKHLNDNLKQKLLFTVREHEEEVGRLREENIFIQNKMIRFKQYEDLIQQLKEQLADAQGDRQKNSDHDRQKRRLNRLLQEKQNMIIKLKEKVDQVNEKYYNMHENQLYMKLELEKKEVRFKQLQTQVKNRLKVQPFGSSQAIQAASSSNSLAGYDEEEMDYLTEEVQKLRVNYRQLERQNLKLKKKVQKNQLLQTQKKKLQKIILDVSRSKDSQIEMLLVSLYEMRKQNIKIHEILTKKVETQ